MLRLTSLLLILVGLGCRDARTDTDPLFLRAETVRYAADTTGSVVGPGDLRQTIIEQFDENGVVYLAEYRDAGDNVQMRFESTVEDGVRTQTDWRRADGSLALYVRFKYDEQGRVSESVQHAPDGTVRRGFRNRWSDDGLRRESGPIPTEGEAFQPDSFFKVNERGEDIELLEFPEVDSMRTLFVYEFPERDEYGNWTVRIVKRDGSATQYETRAIAYQTTNPDS